MASVHDAARRDACYAWLKEMAVHCRFRPGEHLKIGRLCEQLRASSTPVREALILLETEKLVSSTTREGFFARIPSIEEFTDLYHLARTLLVQSVQIAIENRQNTWARYGPPREPSPSAAPWAVIEHLAMTVAQRSGSHEVTRIMGNINDRLRCVRLIASLDAAFVRGMVADAGKSVEAIAAGDAPAAMQMLETIFDRDIRHLPDLTKELLARAHAGGLG